MQQPCFQKMPQFNHIKSYCTIRDNRVTVQGDLIYRAPSDTPFAEFITGAYRENGLKYPKFYKMDPLCRLGFLTAEYLLQGVDLESYQKDRVALVVANAASSLETDGQYHMTIRDPSDYYPSPALFVYTLPNIMIGEICIRQKFMGESVCFVAERFDTLFFSDYVNRLIEDDKADLAICGWVELDRNHDYESVLFLVEKAAGDRTSDQDRLLTAANLERLFSR